MLFGSQAVQAQLAPDFADILNGPDGVVESCFEGGEGNGIGVDCSAYGITPTTDLQMRLAAPEELAAQKSTVKEFSSQQFKAVAARLGSLRAGGAMGGGGSSDDAFDRNGRFSAFANYSHGFGTKDQTGYENEADYTGHDVVLGADYRFNANFVLGGALGYIAKDVKLSSVYSDGLIEAFNADGRSEANGIGLTLYGQWESGGAFVAGSLGNQWLSQDMRRRADYLTTADPADAVPLTATGSTDTASLQASLSGGYVWNLGATSIDASVAGFYQKARTDAFEESGAICPAGECSFDPLDLNMSYGKQTVDSLETSVSLRLSRAMTAGSMVLIPFIDAEFTRQMEDDRYRIRAMYTAIYGDHDGDGIVDIDYFNLATDEVDKSYGALSAGLTFVGRSGWQGFLHYRRTVGMSDVSDNTIAAGVRLEL
jgi:uncharacterized protein YhjY with autotransporter beta-barrel domain